MTLDEIKVNFNPRASEGRDPVYKQKAEKLFQFQSTRP